MTLNTKSASFHWNYIANFYGTVRSEVCDEMKTFSDGTTVVSSIVKKDANGIPEKGCTATEDKDGNATIKCNWKQLATPTCPVPGKNVAMPDNCMVKTPPVTLIIL